MNPWLSAIIGGILIGTSATLLLLLNGRIAGISGIVYGLMQRSRADEWAWRLAFVAGLMLAGGIAMRVLGQATPSPASVPVLVLAGFAVGFGTRLGGGCTSGHGIFGLSNFELPSLVTTISFMIAGIATTQFIYRVLL